MRAKNLFAQVSTGGRRDRLIAAAPPTRQLFMGASAPHASPGRLSVVVVSIIPGSPDRDTPEYLSAPGGAARR